MEPFAQSCVVHFLPVCLLPPEVLTFLSFADHLSKDLGTLAFLSSPLFSPSPSFDSSSGTYFLGVRYNMPALVAKDIVVPKADILPVLLGSLENK
jgi:hypothetical protein